jgi:hypothetical protein
MSDPGMTKPDRDGRIRACAPLVDPSTSTWDR